MAGPLVLPLYMEEWCGIIFKVMGRMGEPETTEKDIGGILICFSVVSEPPGQENTLLKENNMYKKFEMELAGRTLQVDVGRVAKQANGAVLMHYGDTTVLCTATASENQEKGLISSP